MPETPQTLVDAFVANTTDTAQRPQIVTLANGNTLVAFATDNESTGDANFGFTVRGQIFDLGGNPVGEEFVFPFPGVNGVGSADFDIAALDGNRIVIAGNGAFNSLVVREFELGENGVEVIDTENIIEGGLLGFKDYFSPTITDLGDGDYRVDWINTPERGSGLELGRLDKTFDGPVLAEVTFSQFSGTLDAEIDSDTLSNGNRILILDRDGDGGDDGRIHFRVNGPNGQELARGETGSSAGSTRDAKVAALEGGGFVIAWTLVDSDGRHVEFQMFDANGNATTGLITFSNDSAARDNNNEPAIVALEDGGFIIFYDKDRPGGDPDAELQIRGQRFDSAGNQVGEDFLVADENGAQIAATLLADGRVAVTYKVAGEGTVKTTILEFDPEVAGGPDGGDTQTGGDDAPAGDGTIFGTDGNDTLPGTDGNDVIDGLGGDDSIDGGAGDDQIDGGEGRGGDSGGNDTIDGGTGNDDISGQTGDDLLFGGDGDDTILGGFGDDTIDGGDGNDSIDSGAGEGAVDAGNDVIDGGNGSDRILGDAGNDTIDGGSGNDTIDGDAGNDVIDGGGNNDLILGGNGNDQINGGGGSDTIDGGGGSDQITGGLGGDSIFGDNGNDEINGNGGGDIIDGGFGDDTIFGGGGGDVIDGSEGNDVLFGNGGSDTFFFEDGNGDDEIGDFNALDDNEVIDLRFLSSVTSFADLSENHMRQVGDDVVIDDGAGTTITLKGVNIADLDANDFDFADGFDDSDGGDPSGVSDGDDTPGGSDGGDTSGGSDGGDSQSGGDDAPAGDGPDGTILGTAGNDTLLGTDGDDVIDGLGGDDSIDGGAGNDQIDGGEGLGSDSIDGGAGDDDINGRSGDDLLFGNDGNDTVFGEENNDTIFGGRGNDSIDGGSGDDVIDGGSNHDTLLGEEGDDNIAGGSGGDSIFGGAGNDVIAGNSGGDSLDGGLGDDSISGGGSGDTIAGGAGDDQLFGGAGSDSFIFNDGDGNDEIGDFDAGDDNEVIDLSRLSAITNFADLSDNHLRQEEDDVVIDDGAGTTITLKAVNIADLDANDFIF